MACFSLFQAFRILLKKTKKASLSEVQRAEIVTLLKEDYAERAINERVGCGKSAVHQAVVKFQTKRTAPRNVMLFYPFSIVLKKPEKMKNKTSDGVDYVTRSKNIITIDWLMNGAT